jgi:leader peptidase (prepilin peptidase)/N-methyltransferase
MILALVLIAAIPLAWLSVHVTRVQAGALAADRVFALTAVLAASLASAALVAPPSLVLAASLPLAWSLVSLAAIDLAVFRLPDILTLPLLAGGLLVAFLLPDRPVLDHLIGAAAGWGGLVALGWAYHRWRGVDGIGLGDAKLLGAAGAWLGWRPLPSVLLIGCAVAFVWIGVQLMARGRVALSARIAFGAPLCLAIWIVWLGGPISS